ncbi:hypothetical protein LDENG_00297390 [Lucifuga dentata]|nr:hypothetical protein LDENG_00297390 [Lucifuga dentata]
MQQKERPAWAPCFYFKTDKEIYNYVGQEIVIEESIDSYGGMIWPAALALCRYLETHREQLSLLDKAVLEIGAGTGLLSVVAALLGAWVTATDLPDVLNTLRVNLSRNTRGRCRHTPQVAALSWGYDLEQTYPTSVYRYDYVLAADVVYHHDFLDELLVTMKHFCQPGTTLIWANKVRFESDLLFTENFKKAFHTSLLAEDGEMKIFMATCREAEEEDVVEEIQDKMGKEEGGRRDDEGKREEAEGDKSTEKLERHCKENKENNKAKENDDEEVVRAEAHADVKVVEKTKNMPEAKEGGDKEREGDHDGDKEEEMKWNQSTEQILKPKEEEDESGQELRKQVVEKNNKPAWTPNIYGRNDKDFYYYVGQDICIYESIDSFGAVTWPAALALCSFLDDNRQLVNLQGKTVLELGAGTGLVTIVASLLGASVTATDLPVVLGNLRANVMRNTRGRCRYTPQVKVLSWGYDLENTYPTSAYHYDYVLAADVVYHHNFLNELLVTMKHFCQPGTTLIWANKVRFEDDLTFTENFKKAFHTTLLVEDGDIKIFMATCRKKRDVETDSCH